jgi:hypothetical protein
VHTRPGRVNRLHEVLTLNCEIEFLREPVELLVVNKISRSERRNKPPLRAFFLPN